MACS
ncbi:hypothetical protein YPPY08_3513, partial [Yersinia pestis PY-08]|jgi:hypothetical protein